MSALTDAKRPRQEPAPAEQSLDSRINEETAGQFDFRPDRRAARMVNWQGKDPSMPRLIAWIAIVVIVLVAAWIWFGHDTSGSGGGSQPAPHAIDQNG